MDHQRSCDANCRDPAEHGTSTNTTTDYLWTGDIDAHGRQDAGPVATSHGQAQSMTFKCHNQGLSYNNTTQTFDAHGTLKFSGS